MQRPMGGPPLIALVCAIVAGCVDSIEAVDPTHDDVTLPVLEEPDVNDDGVPPPPTVCNDPSAYTPYTTATHPTASVATLPWRGAATTYPASIEDFRGYGT